MKYERKPEIVEAIQWMKPGDHPAVHSFEYENGYLEEVCNEDVVVPGDYIVTYSDGTIEVKDKEEFEKKYEPIRVWKKYEERK